MVWREEQYCRFFCHNSGMIINDHYSISHFNQSAVQGAGNRNQAVSLLRNKGVTGIQARGSRKRTAHRENQWQHSSRSGATRAKLKQTKRDRVQEGQILTCQGHYDLSYIHIHSVILSLSLSLSPPPPPPPPSPPLHPHRLQAQTTAWFLFCAKTKSSWQPFSLCFWLAEGSVPSLDVFNETGAWQC